jgi:hypothetical protein
MLKKQARLSASEMRRIGMAICLGLKNAPGKWNVHRYAL